MQTVKGLRPTSVASWYLSCEDTFPVRFLRIVHAFDELFTTVL